MLRNPLPSITAACLLLAAGLAHADLGEDWLAGKVTTGNPTITYTGAPIEFKYGHPSPPASVLVPPTQANLKRIATASNGKLLIKEYGSGSLFGARDGFKGVRTGVGEWGVCYPTYEGRGMPLSRVWEQPFVTPANPMAATRIAQELASKYFVPEFKKQGVAWGNHVAFQPADILSKKPIRKLEDLQGLKVGAQGMSPDVAKALGVALVNLPYPELYTALQQGVIDAVFWVDAGFVPFKLHEVAKFHTALGLTGGGAWTCYNPRSRRQAASGPTAAVPAWPGTLCDGEHQDLWGRLLGQGEGGLQDRRCRNDHAGTGRDAALQGQAAAGGGRLGR